MIGFIKNKISKYSKKFFFFYFRRRNALLGRKKILLYTDSRGKNLPGHDYYEHYSKKLARKYSVEAHLCPEKWTTLLDFFRLMDQRRPVDYDLVILHAGLVDAAPRHLSNLREVVYPQKKEMFDRLFGEEVIRAHLATDLGVDYEGDKTNNMYSLEMAEQYILPRLKEIPNLIWIGGNKIVPNWQGNYWKPRPVNLHVLESYSLLFEKELDHTVSMMDWTLDDVKKYTYDIIHTNEQGSDILFERLEYAIESFSQEVN